jgi:dsDNA-specific endonuclease/ATPase MutS2
LQSIQIINNLKLSFMAREIAETPILRGKDAKRFREAMENITPLSKEEREEQRKAYEFAKQIATFYLP